MDDWALPISGPHGGQMVLRRGKPLTQTRGVIIAVHGRDMQAEDMLKIVSKMDTADWAIAAPQANGTSWCPERFSSPIEQNEPWLSAALAVIGYCTRRAMSEGFSLKQQVLIGFSQGACLVLEYSARNPAHYGAVVGLAGALFGPLGIVRENSTGLQGTPILMGCAENDPLIPQPHLYKSAEILRKMGAAVDLRLYRNAGHRVTLDEILAVNALLARLPGREMPGEAS
jgi:phospholipase/carboxylesterase